MPVRPLITGKIVTWMRSTRPAAISARLSDRLPCDRKRHVGLLLEAGDDIDGVAARDGGVRPVQRSLQGGRHHRGRGVPHLGDPRVTHVVPSVLAASICAISRNVVAPKTIRCSVSNEASRWSSSSGPCLPQ
jgi:hypothetical protein